MLTLLVETGCEMQWKANTIRVLKQGDLKRKIPVNQLDAVWIWGNVQMDSLMLMRLAEHGVAVSMVPNRGKSRIVRLGQNVAGNVKLSLAQRYVWQDPDAHLFMAQKILLSKLSGYRIALYHPTLSRNSEEKASFYNTLFEARKNILEQQSSASLLGIEGSIARIWNQLIAGQLEPCWQFTGRNRRPPKDPLNGLMSLSYALVLSDVSNAVNLRSFDIAFGFLHELLPGRASLALDMLEPFRPLLDVFCIDLVKSSLAPDDFYTDSDGACKLRKDATSLYFGQFHRYRLDPWVNFILPENDSLWPGHHIHFDGESIPWLARQLADCLAKDLYALAPDPDLPEAETDSALLSEYFSPDPKD